MKLPSIKFVFDRKNTADDWKSRKQDKVKGLLQIEVYYERKRKWYSTGVKLYKGQWDDVKRVINHPNSLQINQQLGATMTRIQEFLADMQREGTKFALGSLDLLLVDKLSTCDVIVDFMALSERLRAKNDKNNRWSTVRFMARRFEEWAEGHGMDTVPPSAMTPQLLADFDSYLHKEGLKTSTVYEIHRHLKQVLETYVKEKVLSANPYSDYKAARARQAKPRYLTEEELQKIKDYKTDKENLEYVRDLFLFQAYTGMSYCDVMSIDKHTRITLEGGRYVIRENRRKTGVGYTVVLLDQAKEILDKYGGCLERYTLVNVDKLLRKIGREVIGRPLSSHMARHTFATRALSLGVPIEYVSKMLGHTNIVTTQRYARVLAEDVIQQFDKLKDL